MNRSHRASLLLLSTALVGLAVADVSVGSTRIPLSQLLFAVVDPAAAGGDILWQFRLPKVITCIAAGGALAIGGLLMQTLFRNPLAGPDVLGLSAGASLAVAVLVLMGNSLGLLWLTENSWSLALAASAGSAVVFLIVIGIAKWVRDHTSLLIVGLMIASAVSALVGVMQYLSRADDLQTFIIWTLGNVGSTTWNEIAVIVPLFLVGTLLSVSLMKPLNGWLLGDHYAASIGVDIKKVRFLLVSVTSLLTGMVTAFCGPIAFVGLAVPHLIRLLIPTTNHKILLPAVGIGGGVLLLFCDILAHIGATHQVLPLNVVTSLIGAPVVIVLVVRNKKIRV